MEQSYHDRICNWLLEHEPNAVIDIYSNSNINNHDTFIAAVKRLIDIGVDKFNGREFLFSDDYKRLYVKEFKP